METTIANWQQAIARPCRVWARTILITIVALHSACVSIEEIAPPVDEHMAALGTELGYGLQTLSDGRHVYLNQCIDCHSPEPVNRYSLDEWEVILPEMSSESKLDKSQQAAIRAYVQVAFQAMTEAKDTEAEDTAAQ